MEAEERLETPEFSELDPHWEIADHGIGSVPSLRIVT